MYIPQQKGGLSKEKMKIPSVQCIRLFRRKSEICHSMNIDSKRVS